MTAAGAAAPGPGDVIEHPGEPSTADVEAGVTAARTGGCDLVVAIGGGSPLDAGKAIAALLTNDEPPLDYLEVVEPLRLVYDHGSDADDDPSQFRVTITFDAQGDDKTVLTLRQFHPTKARREAVIAFGAVELGYQTLDKLAEHLAAR